MLRDVERFFHSYEPLEIVIEIGVIWVCVYLVFRFLRGTRGAGIIKGFALLLVLVTLIIKVLGEGTGTLARLNFIYDRFLGLLAILLIVVFQPELRQFMVRLGQARLFRGSSSQLQRVVDAVSAAAGFLSRNQFGGLIAIERSVGLGGLLEGGERLDAEVSARLLSSIFWPNSPLHDLGVVIRGDRILAANVQFPLAEEGSVPSQHGSRHRAAVGITLESDCVAVVVSEETGTIAVVERGVVELDVPPSRLRDVLMDRLTGSRFGPLETAPAPEAHASEEPPPPGRTPPARAGTASGRQRTRASKRSAALVEEP